MSAKRSGLGSLFIFEGPDGVGKSELAKQFYEFLKKSRPCELLTFPGREPGTLGQLVYALHHGSTRVGVNEVSASALQAAHVAAHIDAIEKKIIPALAAGVTVILDRYWWSTKVYGAVGGANESVIEKLIEAELAAWKGIRPTTAFLIRRTVPLRAEPLSDWRRWRDSYGELSRVEALSYPVCVVDNDTKIEGALDQILRAVPSVRREKPKAVMPTAAKMDRQAPLVFSSLSPAKPSIVFDTYWRFAAARQDVFFRRFEGAPPPWTDDPILQTYKFTNAYRASDRVSQYLIRNVIYGGSQTPEDLFFRTILFKLFNKIETWELLRSSVGEISYEDFSFAAYDDVLTRAMANGVRIYSAAYIMPSGSRIFQTDRKHRAHLALLTRMMEDEVPKRVSDARSMREVFRLLRSYPLIGDFLAYQFSTDLNYSKLCDFDEMQFVVPGPGALDGIRKCFSSLGGLNETDIIKVVADRQAKEFERLGINFRSLWGRPLQLIDCQNLFCEVDKYARVKHPDVTGISLRTRIKQNFRITPKPISLWYPPKWKINDLIQKK